MVGIHLPVPIGGDLGIVTEALLGIAELAVELELLAKQTRGESHAGNPQDGHDESEADHHQLGRRTGRFAHMG